MSKSSYESTLNTWLAELLSQQGLAARPESKQAGGKRLDIELRYDDLKIALEAEQGDSKQKRAEAIKDADSRLRDELADCAIAICYPAGLNSASQLAQSELLHTLRAPGDRSPISKAKWQRSEIAQLASVIRQVPAQLGDPDKIADRLSFSLDRAVARLSESQKQDLAARLDLPAGKTQRIQGGSAQTSRYNQAAKRAMLVIVTAVMFHARLDSVQEQIPARLDNRQTPPSAYTGAWPPPRASACAESDDPIDAFYHAWDMWLVVDYKPIFATARNALHGCAHDHSYSNAVRGVAKAALQVVRNIVGLRHDLLGRIFHKVLETARYDGSFYTTTAAATLLANLAIREDMCDWADPTAISRLRITDPACGTGTLLMAAAERIRDLSSAADREAVAKALIQEVLTGYDVNLTATHLAATTLGLLSPTTTFKNMKIFRALLGVENGGAYLGSLEFLSRENQPRLLGWPTGIAQIESQREASQAEPADLVIMNPPFTRDSLRHDQFDRDDELLMKEREKELFAGQPVHLSSNGNAFLVLAEHIANSKNGAVAAILPLVTATNASALGIRKFLAKQAHVETIVTSHDPTRIYFSENTSIGEMLLICRRKSPHPLAPSPKMREGESTSSGPEKWRISLGLERRMQAVARELRKNPTAAEGKLWQALRKRQVGGRKFRRQVAIGAFVVDFYCSAERLAVEVDGPIHENQQLADRIRQELIESLGIRFVRLTNDEVENHLQDAIDKIRAAFASDYTSKSPAYSDESPIPRSGGGGGGSPRPQKS